MELNTNSFSAIEQQSWQLLQQAVINHKAHFHTGTVVTVFNNQPYARTVVVRHTDEEKKRLSFHTDARSEKVQQLQTCPNLSWLFYSKELRLQLRMQATASINTSNAVADQAWQASRLSSKICYTTSSASGTLLTQPELLYFNKNHLTTAEEQFARQNFCVVETQIHSIDWLYLHHNGHKRCLIDYSHNSCSWIQA